MNLIDTTLPFPTPSSEETDRLSVSLSLHRYKRNPREAVRAAERGDSRETIRSLPGRRGQSHISITEPARHGLREEPIESTPAIRQQTKLATGNETHRIVSPNQICFLPKLCTIKVFWP